MLGHLLSLILGILFGAIALAVIAPSVFPQRTRFRLALALFATGTLLLIGALFADGTRVARPRTLILHHHYVTADESAPAAALLAALAGAASLMALALLFSVKNDRKAPLCFRALLVLSCLIVGVRFVVEKCAASESIAATFGILWLAPALGVRAALDGGEPATPRGVVRLLGLSAGLRLPVVAATLLSTYHDWGTHFSLVRIERFQIPLVSERIFCGTLDERQVLFLVVLPQLVFWPIAMTLVAALSSRLFDRYQRWNAG